MTDERSYIEGSRRAWLAMLERCLLELGETASGPHGWIVERQGAVAILRELCEDFGDNDWPDDLNLSDVLEKHLAPHLE